MTKGLPAKLFLGFGCSFPLYGSSDYEVNGRTYGILSLHTFEKGIIALRKNINEVVTTLVKQIIMD